MKRTPQRIVAEAASSLGIKGCSDHGCIFGHHGGMGTNGGCQELKSHDVDDMRRNLRRLSMVAYALAGRIEELEEAAAKGGT